MYIYSCLGLNTKVYLPYPGVEDGSRVLLVDPCSPKQSQTFSTPVLLTSQGRGQRGHTVEEAMERQEYNGRGQSVLHQRAMFFFSFAVLTVGESNSSLTT